MANRPIIQVKDLIAQYGSDRILDQINFQVAEGEIFVILGGSGCGKTTLLRHIVGLDPPHAGKVLLDGVDICTCGDAAFAKILKKIGILFQGAALFGSMTVAENVALPLAEYTGLPAAQIEEMVRLRLCRVNLGGYENHMPHEISGGMKKRAGLARAMALSPKILFLDEPGAGLDPVTAAGIDELILDINRTLGTTMVIVTHELASVFRVAQRVIMLAKDAKGIIAEGSPEQLRDHSDNPAVRRFFNRQSETSVLN